MGDNEGRFNLVEKPSRFGINLQQVESPPSVLARPAPNLSWDVSPQLVITTVTMVAVFCVLLVLKAGFIITKEADKTRVCLRKLIAWLVLTLVVVHFPGKMRYFYGLLLQPMWTIINKAWSSVLV